MSLKIKKTEKEKKIKKKKKMKKNEKKRKKEEKNNKRRRRRRDSFVALLMVHPLRFIIHTIFGKPSVYLGTLCSSHDLLFFDLHYYYISISSFSLLGSDYLR